MSSQLTFPVCGGARAHLQSSIYSSRVENQLKTIELTARKIEKERVAIVYLGMNERCSDSFSCSGIESISDTTKVTNRHKARFRHRKNMIRHGERCVEYDTEVTKPRQKK